jgi:conjugative relaxase-like TrwC/TraI family protein
LPGGIALVLSIGKLGQGQADYYLRSVAQGIEDYYAGEGEAPGQWLGDAADELDVFGQVEGELLHRALAGQHPATGDQLTATGSSAVRVPGFDLTFSAPKSVSVLYGLGDPDVSATVRDAHEAAVAAALKYMERQAAVGRRGRGGTIAVLGNGFLAAAFRHRSSRAGDPQLHTHVLVANMTRGPDGRWTALDAKRLYVNAKTGGYLYQAHLRRQLAQRLGIEWTPVRKGQAEIAGVPTGVLKAFSRRRAEITDRMADRGETSGRAAQAAALDTRHAKDYAVTGSALRDRWWQRARDLGLDPTDLATAVDRAALQDLTAAEAAAVQDDLASPTGLTAQRSSFTRRDVIQAWCEHLPSGGDVADIEELADAFLASDRAVPLAAHVPDLTSADVIRRADGRPVPATAQERPHSTPELLALEQQVIDRAVSGADAGMGVASRPHVEQVIAARPSLSGEQADMIRRLLTEGAPVQVVVGKAGTGKTFAMDAARAGWEAQGLVVVGAALARRAARELQDGAGIPSTSVTALLADLRDYGPVEVLGRRHAVVVIDEAGMVGTRHLAELLDHARAAEAKVVLLGDPHQLPEIDAGGILRGLVARTDAIELHDNRRQSAQWEREALELLRRGRSRDAIASYLTEGRVITAPSADQVRQRLVDDWWAAREAGADALMIAARRSDVADLNARARAHAREAGRLGDQSLDVAGVKIAVGDQVVTLKNAPRLGVLNGTRATVTTIRPDARELRIATADGADLTLPASYLDTTTARGGPTIDLGYASTGHKAQGVTVDAAFVLGGEELYREWGYVALSRGRHQNRLYIVAPEPPDRDLYAPPEPERDPIDVATAALARSRAQELATDLAADAAIASTPPAYLTAVLGPVPERLVARGVWAAAANRIETYRREHSIDDPERALGQPPNNIGARADHRDTRRQVERDHDEIRRLQADVHELDRGLER